MQRPRGTSICIVLWSMLTSLHCLYSITQRNYSPFTLQKNYTLANFPLRCQNQQRISSRWKQLAASDITTCRGI
jgi:hypothetical protein